MDINDLYFGVMVSKLSWNSYEERCELEKINLFQSSRVMRSVAMYVTMSEEERQDAIRDPLQWCFGDTRWRTEYEFIVCPWPYKDDDTIDKVGKKMDTYSMYVEPNRDYLMSLVNSVSVASAKRWLKEHKR